MSVFGIAISNAQEVKFGAKAGVNFASLGGDLKDLDGRTSFHIGAVAEIVVSEQFSFQPELLYSSQGIKVNDTDYTIGVAIDVEQSLKLEYINLPLMAKFYVANQFAIEAGPQIGFLIAAKSKIESSSNGASESNTEDIKDFYKGIDFGLGAGVSYKLDNGLFCGARYNLGLSNISENGNAEIADDFKTQNYVIQVSVGYFF